MHLLSIFFIAEGTIVLLSQIAIGCTLGKVKVFDSIYFTVYQETLKLIYSIYGANVEVSVENGPKQVGSKDCGLSAIATAIHLANGGDPTTTHFDQNSMRKHLIDCFESRFYDHRTFFLVAITMYVRMYKNVQNIKQYL